MGKLIVQRVYPLVYCLMFFIVFYHLPDPTPNLTNENHYKSFSDSYGTETTKTFMPSHNITASKGHGIPFNVLVQHAKNTDLKIMCTKCSKSQIIYAKKKYLLQLFTNLT